MSDETCYVIAEFVGGPRDGETSLLIGPPTEWRIPMPMPHAITPLDGIASPLRQRIGRYALDGPHVRVTVSDVLARQLGDKLQDFVAHHSDGQFARYAWEGE